MELLPILTEGPTNPHGNTIDLVFANTSAKARVDRTLDTGSDHYTVTTTLPDPVRPAKTAGRFYVPEEALVNFSQILHQHNWTLPEVNAETTTAKDLDKAAQAIEDLFSTAIKTVGRRRHQNGHCAPWWDEECREAQRAFARSPEDTDERDTAKKFLRQTTRKKKAAHWDSIISSASPGRDIFQVARWRKSTGRFQPPPLIHGDRQITDPTDRAAFLREKLLERKSASDDISDPWSRPVKPTETIPWDADLTEDETKAATTGASNTAPGSDGISVKLLKAAWPAIGSYIHNLFKGCLKVGHHPLPFRNAEVTIIPKPNKTDLSSHKAWRPISLLSCIGKGLERLLARRIARDALKHGVIPKQYFGALPKRSATDLVSCVVHDIEKALSRGEVASLLTLDVSGAFDIVTKNRLVLRLREQGWPEQFIHWAESFMSSRTISVRKDDGTTMPRSNLECGTPQGSPISPIIFMLYISPLLSFTRRHERFGYADDVAILATGGHAGVTTVILQTELDRSVKWGQENGISFAQDKTELIHFYRE